VQTAGFLDADAKRNRRTVDFMTAVRACYTAADRGNDDDEEEEYDNNNKPG
jgi:hypothetical protein